MQDILTIMEDMCSQMHNVGNNRITVSLADGHIEEVNHYYPFGGLMGDSRNATTQPYKYNGKELDRTHGLDWYDHGARHYDPVTGRWNVMDALAEKYYPWSPYVSCGDDPVNAIDPNGKIIIIPNTEDREYIVYLINSLSQDIYNYDNQGILIKENNGSSSGFSRYYSDRINTAIQSENLIYISIGTTIDGRDLAKLGEGATATKTREYAIVMISGKECYSLLDNDFNNIADPPEYILAHELVGHAIPWIARQIYSDNRDTGFAYDAENVVRKETDAPLRNVVDGYSDKSYNFSDLHDIPWKGERGQMRPNGDLPMIFRDYLKSIEYNLYKKGVK